MRYLCLITCTAPTGVGKHRFFEKDESYDEFEILEVEKDKRFKPIGEITPDLNTSTKEVLMSGKLSKEGILKFFTDRKLDPPSDWSDKEALVDKILYARENTEES